MVPASMVNMKKHIIMCMRWLTHVAEKPDNTKDIHDSLIDSETRQTQN